MNNDPDRLDPQILRLMQEADPLASRAARDQSLSTEAALRYTRVRVARSTREDRHERKVGGRQRRFSAGLALAGTIAAAVVTLNVADSRIVSIPTADAAVLSQARQALVTGPGHVLEIDAEIISGKAAGEDAQSWTAIDAPHNDRTISRQDGQAPVQTGTVHDRPQVYDSVTNTIYEGSLESPSVTTLGAVSWIRMLSAHGVKIDRHAKLDGQAAIEITQHLGNAVNVYWMEQGTYRPLQYFNNVSGASEAPLIIRYRIWQVLRQGPTSRLTSLSAQHPSARVLRSQDKFLAVTDELGG